MPRVSFSSLLAFPNLLRHMEDAPIAHLVATPAFCPDQRTLFVICVQSEGQASYFCLFAAPASCGRFGGLVTQQLPQPPFTSFCEPQRLKR
jgi:hypothetical protein